MRRNKRAQYVGWGQLEHLKIMHGLGLIERLVFFICDKRKKTATKQGKWDNSRGQVLSLSVFFFNVLEG